MDNEQLEQYHYCSESHKIIIELNGKKTELNERDSGLIKSLRVTSTEFRVKLLNLTITEIDTYLREERMKIADTFRKMFATKCKSKETDELVDWKAFLQADIELPDKITPNKFVKLIENGTLTIELVMNLLDEILDTVKLPER